MSTTTPSGTAFSLDSKGVIRCMLAAQHDGDQPTWCKHIESTIKDGDDARVIHPESLVRVPIFPSNGVWVEVNIGDGEPYNGRAASMYMTYTPDFGKPFSVDLGLWNKGEGRWSMRQVILDRLMSQLDPAEKFDKSRIVSKCPSSMHGFRQQKALISPESISWKWACLWYIVMEKACLPCVELALGDDEDDNNGLGNLGENKPPWKP